MSILFLYEFFDKHCGWIYNNTCILTGTLVNTELEVPLAILKCVLVGPFLCIACIYFPVLPIIRGIGYIIGGFTGSLKAYFVDNDGEDWPWQF